MEEVVNPSHTEYLGKICLEIRSIFLPLPVFHSPSTDHAAEIQISRARPFRRVRLLRPDQHPRLLVRGRGRQEPLGAGLLDRHR